MKRIPINLKDKQHEALRTLAYQENNSISDHVRKAVDEYLKKKTKDIKESR